MSAIAEGLEHDPTWITVITIDKTETYIGQAKTKRESANSAAVQAAAALGIEVPVVGD
ncbi:hypothetical protein FRB93_011890 [Tulasnella sp. JGI-2019a]|nr:hypothetical protein FRB93_011890 [Tulasnella sp. JGI-2019a]